MKSVTAVDIGADSIKVATLRCRKDRFEVIGAGMGALTEAEKNAEGSERTRLLGQALQRVVKKNSIPFGHTVIALPGRGTMMRYLSVPMVPPWKLALLMGFEVEEQIGASGSDAQVAYDYRILSLPEFDEGQFPILLALAQISVIDERIDCCRAGVRRVDDVGMAALGAYNLFCLSAQCTDDEVSVLLDVGAEETHVTLQQGPNLLFARTLSFGGRDFTQVAQKTLGYLGPEAEEYKRAESCILLPEEEEAAGEETLRVSAAYQGQVRTLAGQVQGCIRFFHSHYKQKDLQAQKVFITGGGSRLQGFCETMERAMGVPTEALSPLLVVDVKSESAEVLSGDAGHSFSSVLGLALGRLAGGFSVSLLPPRIRAIRAFWSRAVYAYYAAALLAVLLMMLIVSGRREATYEAERARAWEEHLTQAEAAHKTLGKRKAVNVRIAEQVGALEVRWRSGLDLYRALELLREKTPKNIIITAFSTSEIIKTQTPDEDEGAPAVAPPATLRNVGTFQTNRFVDMQGYVVGKHKPEDARNWLVRFKDSLTKGEVPFFSEVSIRSTEALAADDAILAGLYEMKFSEEEKGPRVRSRRGVPLSFILRCRISKDW